MAMIAGTAYCMSSLRIRSVPSSVAAPFIVADISYIINSVRAKAGRTTQLFLDYGTQAPPERERGHARHTAQGHPATAAHPQGRPPRPSAHGGDSSARDPDLPFFRLFQFPVAAVLAVFDTDTGCAWKLFPCFSIQY